MINAKKPGRAEDPDILKFQAEVRKEAEEMGGAICGIEVRLSFPRLELVAEYLLLAIAFDWIGV